MRDFKKELKRVIKHEPERYASFYSSNEEQFISLVKSTQGVKSDIFLPNLRDFDKINFSSIFSDLVNIYPQGIDKTGNLVIKNVQDVTIPNEILDIVMKDGEMPIMQAGYLTRSDEEIKVFLKK